jgi:DNA-nicking Smr family endonuclease
MKNAIDSIPQQSSLTHNPFNRLKGLVDLKDLRPFHPIQPADQQENEMAPDAQPEEQIFFAAMQGVNPIARDNVAGKSVEREQSKRSITYSPENESLSHLVNLVDNGTGFIVSDTPEYIEGTGYNVHQGFTKRLHQGDFSIQAHIDLHGHNVDSAKEAFESFLKASINAGKRAVLIIHGRGLSSPGDSILKNKVREWLGQSYWLKRVIAYTSAQSYDGGAGATYVLLRSRPVAKKSLKKRSATKAGISKALWK